MMTLPSTDEEMFNSIGENAVLVVAAMSMVPDLVKRIEQVGSAYEKLKVRVSKMR